MHMHTNDSINERYVKFLLTKFDKLVYHVKICIDQQKNEISEEFEKMLSDTRRNDYKHTYKTIDNGKSFSVITDFEFKDLSAIRIYCNKFTKETTDKRNFFNGLSVSISPVKILNWLNNKAYKQ